MASGSGSAGAEATEGAGRLGGETIAGAAALLALVAERAAEGWSEWRAAAAQARTLERRARRLTEQNAAAYARARAILAAGSAGHDDVRLQDALIAAADGPLRLAEAAVDVAELAALTADHADPFGRADAAATAALAAGAARAVAHLVEVNLSALVPGDARGSRARAHAAAAQAAAARALSE